MRTTAELDLLEQIYTEMQELKRRMENNQERRIGRQEFAHMLNIEPETLDARIRDGRYQKPLAHADENKTKASYNHAKHLENRRKMLQDWADIVDSWKD